MNMHRFRSSLSNAVPPALMAAVLIAAPMAAQAITSIPPTSVAVSGNVSDAAENVKFNGNIAVEGKVIDDLVFNSPQVLELVIDFSNVKGVGNKTGKQYVNSAQAILHRPLKSKDIVEVTLPFYSESDPADSRAVIASFEVSFNGANNVKMKLDLKPAKF